MSRTKKTEEPQIIIQQASAPLDSLRFNVIGGESMLNVVALMNHHANALGRCIYFGRNEGTFAEEYAYIAIFDGAALPVVTLEDLHDLQAESMVVDTTLEEYKGVSSA